MSEEGEYALHLPTWGCVYGNKVPHFMKCGYHFH
jgi:hypothetical protein